MLLARDSTDIERILAHWRAENPSFLWIPTAGKYLLHDRISGYVGRPILGGGALVTRAGFRNTVANSSSNYIQWDTNAGVTTGTTNFIGMALVSVLDPAAVTGTIVKIGNSTTGLGFGGGNTTLENSGVKLVTLAEGIVWYANGSYTAGLNVVSFGYSSDGNVRMNNYGSSSNAVSSPGASYNAPSAVLHIGGYFTSRGTNMIPHAVAVFRRSSLSGAEFDDETLRLGRKLQNLLRAPRPYVEGLFKPRRIWVPGAAGAGSSFNAAWVRNRSQVIGAGVR